MKRTYYWAVMLSVICLIAGCRGENEVAKTSAVKVKTEKAGQRPINGILSFSGTIEEESGSALSFMTGGTLEKILVSQGQSVSRGTLLAVVDGTTARNAYEATLATRQQAEDAYARMKQLHDNNSLPEIQWIEVQSKLKQAVAAEQIAGKNLSDSNLYAPYNGFISDRIAEAGQNVLPGMPVLKIVKIDRVKVKIAVPEKEIARIKKGTAVKIRVSALDGKSFDGTVTEKGVTAHPLSRSYEVKALVDNTNYDLLPGMVCDVSLNDADDERTAVVLPAHIISIDSENRPYVWIIRDGKATRRFVTTGAQLPYGVVITSGLDEGEEVVTEGSQKLSEGMAIIND